ncbi:MAG: VWA domain-containing protein [Lentisphaeria bacterium]|nr:VWA domain-containing protein [Lentisphaeria bacterium]
MMTYRFENPWALLALLLPVFFFLIRRFRKRRTPALHIATGAFLQGLPKSLRMRCQWMLPAVCCMAWMAMTIALARPQKGHEQIQDRNEGIAIEMLLDRSGSMAAEMDYNGRRQNRLDTVKDVFSQFVLGDKSLELSGRHNDLLGVVAFAHYPYTMCPLTLDHNALSFALKNIELIEGETDENGTAIGDAVAMGVARLAAAEKTLADQNQKDASAYHLQSKVIILLTDGQDEGPHTYSIEEASALAKKHGIRVYSIAILTPKRYANTPFGIMQMPDNQYDTTAIEAMASETGGIFQTCDNAEDLAEIYKKIDTLEKSHIDSVRYVTHHELYRPFLEVAFALVIAAIALKITLCKRL